MTTNYINKLINKQTSLLIVFSCLIFEHSFVCDVPVDDWFPSARDDGTKAPQCAWPNLEGGATVEKTASVKSERFRHRYTAAPLLSHLPQHTWVVTEKSLRPITKILLSRTWNSYVSKIFSQVRFPFAKLDSRKYPLYISPSEQKSLQKQLPQKGQPGA